MAENMKIWDTVKQPPPEALKEIKGGRIAGMTDINPQWRYQVMTEQFGVCGVGWKYEVEVWNEPSSADQIFAFAKVNLYVKIADKWSEPIPGIGGSMLVTKEMAGLHSSDEGYKMAITDALSVAMKMLGVGANIYAGLSDSKYSRTQAPKSKSTPVKRESDSKLQQDADLFPEDPPNAKTAAQQATEERETVEGLDMNWLKESLSKIKWPDNTATTWLTSKFKVEGGLLKDVLARLTKEQLGEFVGEIEDRLKMV